MRAATRRCAYSPRNSTSWWQASSRTRIGPICGPTNDRHQIRHPGVFKMSIVDVRAAFILAGAGELSLHDAAMRHVGAGAHVLQFVGAHRDGVRFDHVSPPFRGDPDRRAREIAAELISAHAVSTATMINPQEDR